MTDEGPVPPELLAFYSRYGQEIILSAAAAISDSIQEHTGHATSLELRQQIADILTESWVDYAEWVNSLPATDADMRAGLAIVVKAAVSMSQHVSDAVGHDVVDALGVPIFEDVQRALLNLAEALANILRDTVIKYRGFDPRKV